jgi:lysophospholipase L1-like esterase
MRRLPETFRRYIAIGDSSTEGIDDPAPGGGWRGWSRRLAERIAEQGCLEYANLGVRGRTTREIKNEQLAPALALKPDLVTFFSGTNDVISLRFDLEGVLADMRHVHRACVAAGAVVLTFTLPDLTPLLSVARLIAPRIRAMNAGVRRVCADTGALLVDFASHPIVATDPRLWSDDRVHANATGHTRIANALAEALRLPGSSAAWCEPLPTRPAVHPWKRLTGEVVWARRHLLPWIWLGLTRDGASVRTWARVTDLERIEPAYSTPFAGYPAPRRPLDRAETT